MTKSSLSPNRSTLPARCLGLFARAARWLLPRYQPRCGGTHGVRESKPVAAPLRSLPKPVTFTILVVDDDSICRQMLAAHLRTLDQHVEAVDGGPAALDRLQSQSFDIVFLDLYMPDMDGVQTAEAIRRLGPHYSRIPIIGLTADYQRRAMKQALDSGMDAFLTKPIGPADLAHILRHWHERGAGDFPGQAGHDRVPTTLAF